MCYFCTLPIIFYGEANFLLAILLKHFSSNDEIDSTLLYCIQMAVSLVLFPLGIIKSIHNLRYLLYLLAIIIVALQILLVVMDVWEMSPPKDYQNPLAFNKDFSKQYEVFYAFICPIYVYLFEYQYYFLAVYTDL